MDDKNDVNQDSSPETEVEVEETTEEVTPEEVEETVREDVKTPTPSEPIKEEENTVPFKRFKEVNDQLADLKKQKNTPQSLGVDDYIDISASLEGLDKREKEYLAREHKLSGSPLKSIREGEDFGLWQSAYRAKVEKEQNALKPSGAQLDEGRPQSMVDQLRNASLKEKEELLAKAGLYKSPQSKQGRVKIGD